MSSTGGAGRPGSRQKPSAKVIRRRRQAAAILALLVLGGLVWAVFALVGLFRGGEETAEAINETSSAPEDSASAAPSSASPSPTPSPTPSTPVCNPAFIEVTAATDAATYAPDQKPVLTLTVTNKNEVECPVNVGTSQMEFLITSGEDRIFSSRDCQEGAEDLEVSIEPGASETARFTWERIRSAEGCTAVEAAPGAGQYVFKTRLGERTSEEVVFTLE